MEPRAQFVPVLSRLYVWSIVLEPLLFFTLFQQTVTGVGGNLSRLLQGAVVIGMLTRLALATGARAASIRFVDLSRPLYSNYLTYWVLAVLAGIIGAASGAFTIGAGESAAKLSAVSGLLNSAAVRPLFEYVIAAYYFVYFTILPQFMLKSREGIAYFFRAFRIMLVACLVVGAVDLAAAAVNIELVPRIFIERIYVGTRFHGLAGEPRDAFVYAFFALAVLHLQATYLGERLQRKWIGVLVLTAVLTQSASGLVGLLIFVGLYVLYTLPVMGRRRMFQLLALSAIVLFGVYQAVSINSRLMLYVAGASGLWDVLESGSEIPGAIAMQMQNIFPLYDLLVKARQFDWSAVLFGSGLGSSATVTSRYADPTAGLSAPNSQIVRTLYESGIAGTFFFTKAFTQPVQYLTRNLPVRARSEFLVFTLLLLGCFFGHRSSTAFIYVGIVIAVFRNIELGGATAAPLTPTPVK